jgi:hypothetical protein
MKSVFKGLGISLFFQILILTACNTINSTAQSNLNRRLDRIPHIFLQNYERHQSSIESRYRNLFLEFCEEKNIDPSNLENGRKFYLISFLHEFFTSQTSSTGSKGDLTQEIPYYWHYGLENPRDKIILRSNGINLGSLPPPQEFRRYLHYSSIDRTPALYLTDLFETEAKYQSEEAGIFSTFGWCSEREMAFVCLLDLIGFKGKVVASGAHSWSEFWLSFGKIAGGEVPIIARVDNTYNSLSFEETALNGLNSWTNNFGNTKEAGWYNQKAHSGIEKQRIRNFRVSENAKRRISDSVGRFYKQ